MEKNLLLNDVQMDTQTSYFVNGDINVFACPWNEPPTLTEGSKTSYRGRITVMSNGETRFKAYRDGTKGPLYQVLYQTEHCRVLLYQSGRIMEQWSFDKRLSVHEVCKIRKRESPMITAFFLTLK
jgi:hypothetical protein